MSSTPHTPTERPFELFGLSPGGLPPRLAQALGRCGATGLVDLVHVADLAGAAAHVKTLIDDTPGARVGLRLHAEQVGAVAPWLAACRERPLTVVLAIAELGALQQAANTLREAHPGLTLWCELTDPEQAPELAAFADGLIAVGHEAGGWVGEDTSLILLQKLQTLTSVPVMARGGLGLHAAAACRIAGACGMVLDDCLLLLGESPLPLAVQQTLQRLNGGECRLLGERIGQPLRVYGKPGSAALKAAEADDRAAEGEQLDPHTWRAQQSARVNWHDSVNGLLPVGQAIGLAALYRDRFGTVAKLVQAIRRASHKQIAAAARLNVLAENGPLARAHGTRFPVVQGPMTRVSDNPDFAVSVAEGGGLPMLALALMRGPQVRTLLEQTRDRIGDKPWGVGLLGFVPQALREEQCAEIWKCPPPFALIAGGRPDQAAEFEQRGITTYIHAPAPALLRLYLEQGARRFVFEGRECGGHVGPIASLPMWEQMIEVLLAEVPPGQERHVHVLFAGGIHDDLSCAMVAAMTAPLAARGMKVGVLMGTAYLFTREIVHTGAIVQGFQDEALRCRHTVNLESGPGHASRCVDSPFAREFFDTRRRLIREGLPAEAIRDQLEDLNLGRLRIASKGVNRADGGDLVALDAAAQQAQGMFMIGQAATLRSEPVTIADLHREVCHGAHVRLQEHIAARRDRLAKAQPSDIAIVGIGTLMPKADGPETFWHNLLHQVCAIGPVPPERWDPALYYDADPKARDKTYSQRGGFLDELPFDPMRYGIPPRSMKSIDPMQLLTLEVAHRTLADAGYGEGGFDREHTSIILGAGGGLGDLGMQYGVRAELPRFIENPDPRVLERLPEWTEESFAGTLLNVAAGRVANRMDFGGLNFTVDAACASSLAAISIAVNELETGRSNLVLAGGIDTVQSAFGFICFSKTQALSPSGTPRTFDQKADGIAISEGLAVVALKRLADAERDGDRIYAVIKSVAGSSDGKALGLTAPRPDGQIRALDRAYAKAGFSPATLELFEAHGTGTPVGDKAEAETITRALRAEGAPAHSVALGSLKTLYGHTKASAGVAGLIKMALALHHRVQPAHFGVDQPIAALTAPDTPAYLLRQPRPWVAHPEHPRRAGVSAFGFGGTNFHAVLEEYAGHAAASGDDRWPVELLVFRAENRAQLQQQLEQLQPVLAAPGRLTLAELALALARATESRTNAGVSLALVADDLPAAARDLARVRDHLDSSQPLPPTARLNLDTPATPPKVAFLFPGQGAQYVNMGREAALYLDEVRSALEQADRHLQGRLPSRLSQYILPPAAFSTEAEAAQQAALTDTRVAQPAIGALALGYTALAQRLGLRADACAGHSYGEYVALAAAGVMGNEDCLNLSAVRGAAMASASAGSVPGAMAAVQGTREAIDVVIAPFDGVRVANHNTPAQSVISGPKAALEPAVSALEAAGLRATLLPVSGAFHTELVADARPPLSAAIADTPFQPARCAVYSNTRGARYPDSIDDSKALLDDHLLSSVEFVRELTAMADDGCQVFIELGPKGICANMARATLEDRTGITAVSLDGQGGGLKGLLSGLATVWTAGVPVAVTRLFDQRALRVLDVAGLATAAAISPLPAHVWQVSGGCARPPGDTEYRTGMLPPLTRATRDAAQAQAANRIAPPESTLPPDTVPTGMPAVIPSAAAGSGIPADALVAYQQTMQQFLALQERVMQQALGGSPGVLPAMPAAAATMAAPVATAVAATTVPVATAKAAAPPPVADVAPQRDQRQVLLAIVAERTGYPEDMLALDADLEADLGIDSIKRVEIIGALRKAQPDAINQAMQAQIERFTQARSLQAMLDALAVLTPAATATAASQPAETPAAADATATLLAIVAERTGYPEDMLALDADLEADLGIDSIKRVEIIGALRKAQPDAINQAMQAQIERFTQARSLQAMLDALAALTPDAAPVATAPATLSAEAAVLPSDPTALLLGIVAERTGYPEDMLALDADLEADLGIDSIKRVEIIGALRKAQPDAINQAMQAQIERFTQARSLQAMLDALQSVAPSAAAERTAEGPAEPAAADRDVVAEEASIPRYVVRPRPAPLPARRVRLTGTALVVAAPDAIRDALGARLRAEGLHPVHVSVADPDAVTATVAQARPQHGPIRAVLHLSGLDAHPADTVGHWQAGYQPHLLSMLHLAQALGDDLATVRMIGASRLGGSFGRSSVGDGSLLAGGLNGLFNCLRHEYPEAVLRAVDFNGQTDSEIVAALCDELLCDDTAPEAGYIGDQRMGSVALEQAVIPAATPLTPDADWVVLATGGARGITAELLEEMAVPGMRLVLLGRSALPEAEAPELRGLDSITDLRAHLLTEARTNGLSVKPVEIDRRIARIEADREIRANLARLQAAGCTVDYRCCDVRDAAALKAEVSRLYDAHGRIDAVLHGAGVIEDKLITDKQAESFLRVIGTKLDSAQTLCAALQPGSLKLLCLFTSVAGRFGNRGQSDYAAANEVLNRLAWHLHRRWPDTRVMAINWGPWNAGMASDRVKEGFRKQGITPIPVAAGRRYFRDELMHGGFGDVEVVAGRGTWGVAADAASGHAAHDDGTLPLIRHAPRMGPGGAMTLDHVFSAEHDPYLLDHRVDGKLVLPLSAAAEWLAQFAAAAWPGWQVSELRDLQQFHSIAIDRDGERLMQLRARASSHSDAGTQSITVEWVDPAQKRSCLRATVCLVERLPEAPVLQLAPVKQAQTLSVDDAYQRFLFQGDRLRLIQRIDGIAPRGIDARVAGAAVAGWLDRDGHWLLDPGLLDTVTQLGIVWSRVHHDMTALTTAVGRIQRYAGRGASGPVTVALRLRTDEPVPAMGYDAWLLDDEDRVLLAIERASGQMSTALNRLAAEHPSRG